ncbi:MAG: Uma2 family endonuclease [Thermoanaerobaculia bacterium]
MAKPARTPGHGDEPDDSGELETDFVHRWVKSAGGQMELQEFPLTPEYFLDPQIGDQVVQSYRHWRVTGQIHDIVSRHVSSLWEEVLVLSDQKLLWGHREWRRPAPDITVIPNVPNSREWEGSSFNVAKTGLRPCLIIEVVSFSNAAIRNTDLVDKVKLYEREKIREYLALDPPLPANGYHFQWIGYRLADGGRYRAIEPDAEGRIVSETVGLAFGVSPDGKTTLVFDARTGERLYTASERAAQETERAAREAERATRETERAARETERATRETQRATREAEARKDAEDEVARLREEIARLKGTAG